MNTQKEKTGMLKESNFTKRNNLKMNTQKEKSLIYKSRFKSNIIS